MVFLFDQPSLETSITFQSYINVTKTQKHKFFTK